jgi:hypothetical protein
MDAQKLIEEWEKKQEFVLTWELIFPINPPSFIWNDLNVVFKNVKEDKKDILLDNTILKSVISTAIFPTFSSLNAKIMLEKKI